MRHSYILCLLPLVFCAAASILAQSTDATISGQVVDPTGRVIPDADIQVLNEATGVQYTNKTNNSGIYTVSILPPGQYRVQVSKIGFKTLIKPDIVLNVQSAVALNFTLPIGATSESVTVEAGSSRLNTTDASVGTVVDRQFVENMPLNGRSFQSLVLLAPGTSTNSPQVAASSGQSGEYAMNGQRGDANNFSVDGVSANSGAYPYGYSSAGSAGALPATTALGTTQALVPIDALQEFRIQTSTYSAQYGRQPGGQVSFETRSGTNDWHGSAFDYLRNDVFDANNWFNDDSNPPTRKPAERQNDFGGTLGSVIRIPAIYLGRDRTFYFFSYEGLRLSQPQPAQVTYVPSTELRQQAPPSLQPALNAWPLPNCTVANSSLCVDPGNGLSPFLFSTSLPSSVDSFNVRLDQHFASWLNTFFRYGTTNGSAETSATASISRATSHNSTFTLGGDMTFTPRLTNQIRLNYSSAESTAGYALADYGGATQADLLGLHGFPSGTGLVVVGLYFPGYGSGILAGGFVGRQHQINVVDTLAWQRGAHLLTAGIDYRSTSARAQSSSPELSYTYSSMQNVLNNSPSLFVLVTDAQYPKTTNFSAFVQDEWRVNDRINLSLGVRWELNPPPSVTSGPDSRTVNGDFNNPGTLTLAPAGTPLYQTTYYNLAPRLGLAAKLHDSPGRELVFRAGGGVYFDTGQQLYGVFGLGDSPGTGFSNSYAASPSNAFPISPSVWNTPPSLTPPYTAIYTTSQDLQLPYTFQWNATLEQALGSNQSLSIGYVGSNGRRLLRYREYSIAKVNPTFTDIIRYENGLSSSYNSLQVQYKRTLSRGLQALGSYTWSHALDYQSTDATLFPYQRGNADFDVRNNFSGALSYNIPAHLESRVLSGLLSHWGADLRFTARTGFPITFNGNQVVDPITGTIAYSGLNYLGGSVYKNVPSAPGDRVINAAVFQLPSSGQYGNAPRNSVRGFGEEETNLAIRRQFPIHERLNLQFRAEAFNLLNHPNFGFINTTYGNALFGQATSTLASSLGGLTSLYQQGGPRSMQFALKLQF
jgi:Carboxypeptidase regulatory-like domain/TonB dependent receptor